MLFLKANGHGLQVATPDVVDQVIALVERRTDEAAFAAWLRGAAR